MGRATAAKTAIRSNTTTPIKRAISESCQVGCPLHERDTEVEELRGQFASVFSKKSGLRKKDRLFCFERSKSSLLSIGGHRMMALQISLWALFVLNSLCGFVWHSLSKATFVCSLQ